jgi:hypothetical protein
VHFYGIGVMHYKLDESFNIFRFCNGSDRRGYIRGSLIPSNRCWTFASVLHILASGVAQVPVSWRPYASCHCGLSTGFNAGEAEFVFVLVFVLVIHEADGRRKAYRRGGMPHLKSTWPGVSMRLSA